MTDQTPTSPHTLFDDLQALFTAAAFIALGIGFFNQAGLLTGGTAGLALLLTKMTDLSFGQWFFMLNLPFYYLALRRMGWRFTLKTFMAIFLVSLFSDGLSLVLEFAAVNPVYCGLMGGFLIGAGLLMLFRHQASLGGLNILALYLQERCGIRAGWFQMAIDLLIVVASFFVVSLEVLLISVLGAVAVNIVLAINHKPGRYALT